MYTVLCIGDSITEGIGSSKKNFSYVSDLQILLGKEYEVLNFGRNGATLMPPPNGNADNYKILPHFFNALTTAKYAYEKGNTILVSIMLGTNDADVYDYGFPTDVETFNLKFHDQFISEYFYLLDSILSVAPNARFILCKSPFSYDTIKHQNFGNLSSVWNFQEEVFSLCLKRGLLFTINDMAEATAPNKIGLDGVENYFRDKLHPNDVGHMYFAHYFFEAVKNAEKLREL